MRFLALIAVLVLSSPVISFADQYAQGGHVVHTRRAPVIAHKIVPPFRGVHVYQGRGGRR